MSQFKILHKDKKTKARVGILQTKKGSIETPFFMPVATKASVKHISSKDLEEMNCKAIISNMFILHLKPGEKTIKKLGGIGNFMNFQGINTTDSGGFQMYSSSLYIKSTDKGVWFRNPFTKEKVFISPEKDMQIQLDLNSEIAMCLDEMPFPTEPRKKIQEAIRKTAIWAKRCKEEHDRIQKNKEQKKRQLLFGIIQGGIDKKLRQQSTKDISKLNFDGYSIGGLALGETQKQEMQMVETVKTIIPENKPCYLMGTGNPTEILEAISRGVDMFDSRFPTQNARHGTILTSEGKLRLLRKKYELDKTPLDKNCKCKVCKNYSRAYIRYQLQQQEALGKQLATYHNLYYLTRLMEQARQAIKANKFSEFKSKVKKAYKNAEKSLKKPK